jgi:pimeloyl-ACP methyl ester carboxylesterase
MPYVRNPGCELYYDTFGSPTEPTLLLVNGLGSQCINFADAWCAKFVARGFHVIRFDNRDVGLSTHFVDAPVGQHGEAYSLSDMAGDAIAVLDANGVERAHVMGLSMGGMIVQTLAIEHPDRLLSMTSVMSHTGEPDHQTSSPEAWAHLTRVPPTNRDEYVTGYVAGLRIWGSPAYADENRWRALAEQAFDRCFDPLGTRRQFLAIAAAAPRADLLREVDLPVLVIHGDCDTLIGIEGGRRTAELIPGARFEAIEGMGHDYPPQMWDRWVTLVGDFALG